MIQISNLRNAPRFAAIIADRCWNEWWTDSDVSLAKYAADIAAMAAGSTIPLALVAYSNEEYVGSVLLIENDLKSRPQYRPWIAALWVEPAARRGGIAGRLIKAAREEAEDLDHHVCYLCATDSNSLFYLARGFRLVETNVDGLNILAIEMT